MSSAEFKSVQLRLRQNELDALDAYRRSSLQSFWVSVFEYVRCAPHRQRTSKIG
jgi:hypothetical protein